MLTEIGESFRQKLVAATNKFKPTTTAPIKSEQTITFTKTAANTGKPKRCVRKTNRKRDPQRTEKRKEMEQRRKTDKIIDGILMEVHREPEVEDGNEQSREQTSTTIDVSNEDESSAAEAQQISNDLQ